MKWAYERQEDDGPWAFEYHRDPSRFYADSRSVVADIRASSDTWTVQVGDDGICLVVDLGNSLRWRYRLINE